VVNRKMFVTAVDESERRRRLLLDMVDAVDELAGAAAAMPGLTADLTYAGVPADVARAKADRIRSGWTELAEATRKAAEQARLETVAWRQAWDAAESAR